MSQAEGDAPKKLVLLEIAARIVAEEGDVALTTRRLAAEAGTSTMALYTWYGGKPKLLRAIYREAFGRFDACLRSVPTTADPGADLLELARAYRHYGLDNPNLYEVMFGRRRLAIEPTDEDLELAIGTFGVLVSAVSRCVDAGWLDGDPDLVARPLWAALHGEVMLELAGGYPPGPSGEVVFEALLQAFIDRSHEGAGR